MSCTSWTYAAHVLNSAAAAQEGSAFVAATSKGTCLAVSEDPLGKGVCKTGNDPYGTIGGILDTPRHFALVTTFKEIAQELVNCVGRLQLQLVCTRGPWNSPGELLSAEDWRAWPDVTRCAAGAARGGSKRQNNLVVFDDKLKYVPRMLFAEVQVNGLAFGATPVREWCIGITEIFL